jgi:hypothetical protein
MELPSLLLGATDKPSNLESFCETELCKLSTTPVNRQDKHGNEIPHTQDVVLTREQDVLSHRRASALGRRFWHPGAFVNPCSDPTLTARKPSYIGQGQTGIVREY